MLYIILAALLLTSQGRRPIRPVQRVSTKITKNRKLNNAYDDANKKLLKMNRELRQVLSELKSEMSVGQAYDCDDAEDEASCYGVHGSCVWSRPGHPGGWCYEPQSATRALKSQETRLGGDIDGHGSWNHMYCDREQCRTDISNCEDAFDKMHEDKDTSDLLDCPVSEGWKFYGYCREYNWWPFKDQYIKYCWNENSHITGDFENPFEKNREIQVGRRPIRPVQRLATKITKNRKLNNAYDDATQKLRKVNRSLRKEARELNSEIQVGRRPIRPVQRLATKITKNKKLNNAYDDATQKLRKVNRSLRKEARE